MMTGTDEIADRVIEVLVSSDRGVFLITHQNADLDAVGACIALEELLSQRKISVRMGSGSKPSQAGRRLLDHLDGSFEIRPKDPEGLPVLVDVQNPDQFAPLEPWERPVIIDHHPAVDGFDAAAALVDTATPSACELVWRLYERSGTIPTRRAAIGLIAGMVADTMSFRLARTETFRAVHAVLGSSGVEYQEVLEAIRSEPARSARIANLKGAQRCDITKVGPWLVAVTRINSFEADVANALVGLGADVAIVAAQKKGGNRISVRARKTFIKRTGIHVAKDLLVRIEPIVQGTGGGHPAAASINGTVNLEEGIEALLAALTEQIGDEGHGC